ncbi:hypothetical protein [Agromyces italicus]|uniref:hypothetical protein n=1 Tax=Agromyces italicus TaxID=279572 RepID=UPI0003B567DF|nr:hypothetical protein [Agromyces italicus]
MELWTLLVVVVAVLWLGALVYVATQIFGNARLNELEKWVWVIALVCFTLPAALVWFILGPHPFGIRLSRELR